VLYKVVIKLFDLHQWTRRSCRNNWWPLPINWGNIHY